jgi:hypothetical protein
MRIAQKLLLLCALLPGCVKPVEGYCDINDECLADQFCSLPAHACKTGPRQRSCSIDNQCATSEFCLLPDGVCTAGTRKRVCATNTDCRGDQLCLAPDCVDAIAAGVFSGAQTLPPTPSVATGMILFYLKPNNADMVYSMTHGVASPTAARLNAGKQGEAGSGVIFELKKENGTLDTIVGFPSDQITELAKGNLFVSVPSATYPTGEVRAQIYPLGMVQATGPTSFIAALTPLQTPLVVSSTFSGRADVTIDEAAATVSYTVAHNIDMANDPLMGLHLHRGTFNTEGPHIADVTPVPTTLSVTGALAKTQFAQMYPESAPLWSLLIKSGASYFNVHTMRASGGELRGQLLPFRAGSPIAVAMPFNSKLVPQGASAATGVAGFFLSQDQATLTWRLAHTAVNATSAQIIKNVGGAIVCDLGTGQDKAMGTCPPVKAAGMGTDLILSDLQNTAGALTLIVKTQAVPAGELRGAVVAPKLP